MRENSKKGIQNCFKEDLKPRTEYTLSFEKSHGIIKQLIIYNV